MQRLVKKRALEGFSTRVKEHLEDKMCAYLFTLCIFGLVELAVRCVGMTYAGSKHINVICDHP